MIDRARAWAILIEFTRPCDELSGFVHACALVRALEQIAPNLGLTRA